MCSLIGYNYYTIDIVVYVPFYRCEYPISIKLVIWALDTAKRYATTKQLGNDLLESHVQPFKAA